MLTEEEAKNLENKYIEDATRFAQSSGDLLLYYKQLWEQEKAAHQQTREERDAARGDVKKKDQVIKEQAQTIAQLEDQVDVLKRSQHICYYYDGAVHNDNSQNIQLLGGSGSDSTLPMLGTVL